MYVKSITIKAICFSHTYNYFCPYRYMHQLRFYEKENLYVYKLSYKFFILMLNKKSYNSLLNI